LRLAGDVPARPLLNDGGVALATRDDGGRWRFQGGWATAVMVTDEIGWAFRRRSETLNGIIYLLPWRFIAALYLS